MHKLLTFKMCILMGKYASFCNFVSLKYTKER